MVTKIALKYLILIIWLLPAAHLIRAIYLFADLAAHASFWSNLDQLASSTLLQHIIKFKV